MNPIFAHQIKAHGIPHLLMAQRSGKRAYDPRKPQGNILTVQSSKGLEFQPNSCSMIWIAGCSTR